MELTIADKYGKEIGFLRDGSLDIDLGDTNDFVYDISLPSYDKERFSHCNMIYIPGTEYGGLIYGTEPSTKTNVVTLSGDTWRGMMDKKILEPPAGQTYLTVSGELNSILYEVIGSRFGSLFSVPDTDTGVTINYKFDRYTTLLNGLAKMLSTVGHRLQIMFVRGDPGGCGYVSVEAVPSVNFSDQLEYSQDGKVYFRTRDYRGGINHLICAGEGEGIDRTVLHLYVQKDGTIGDVQYYKDLDERTALYSYTSQDDAEKLREDGTKRLKELMDYKEFEMSIEDANLEIGDIVSGRDRITGILVQKPIVQKIFKLEGSKKTISYKLKEGD